MSEFGPLNGPWLGCGSVRSEPRQRAESSAVQCSGRAVRDVLRPAFHPSLACLFSMDTMHSPSVALWPTRIRLASSRLARRHPSPVPLSVCAMSVAPHAGDGSGVGSGASGSNDLYLPIASGGNMSVRLSLDSLPADGKFVFGAGRELAVSEVLASELAPPEIWLGVAVRQAASERCIAGGRAQEQHTQTNERRARSPLALFSASPRSLFSSAVVPSRR